MKSRELRHRVLLPARLNRDGRWDDVRIRNVSARGLGLECSQPLRRGSFVEVRSGRQVIVGYVVWCDGAKSGLRAQDPIDLSTFLGATADRGAIHARNAEALAGPRRNGRSHRPPTPAEIAERSRQAGQRFQFVAMIAVFAGAAGALGTLVLTGLSSLSDAVRAGLGG